MRLCHFHNFLMNNFLNMYWFRNMNRFHVMHFSYRWHHISRLIRHIWLEIMMYNWSMYNWGMSYYRAMVHKALSHYYRAMVYDWLGFNVDGLMVDWLNVGHDINVVYWCWDICVLYGCNIGRVVWAIVCYNGYVMC